MNYFLSMNFLNILILISAIFVLFLGIFVLLKNKKSKINFTFSLHAISATVWLAGTLMMFLSGDNEDAVIFWDRVVYAGVAIVPAFMYHFGLSFVGKKNNILLYIAYFLSAIFLFSIFSGTDYFIGGIYEYSWGLHTRAGFLHGIFIAYFITYAVLWFIMVFRYYKNLKSYITKEQTKYVFMAFLVLFTVAPFGFLSAYGVDIYPFSYMSSLVFVVILAYAIVAKGFMDIKLALRKSSVYIASLVVTLIPAFILKYLINRYFPFLAYWGDFILIVIAVSLFPYLRKFFFRAANKYLFASLYDSKKLIGVLTNSLSSTIEEGHIHKILVDSLQDAFHTKGICIMNYNKEKDNFFVKYNVGFDLKLNQEIKINRKLINSHILKDNVVLIEELKATGFGTHKQLLNLSNKLGIKVIAPMTLENKIVGIILVGEKESGDAYNKEDLEVIDIIDSQMAISLENALLYGKAKEFNNKLKREVDSATKNLRNANVQLMKLDKAKSEFISIASHQLRTPLTVVKGYGSMILDGTFGNMDPKVKDNITKIYDSNERLIGLVEDLLNVSRIESGRLKFDFVDDQLDDIIASVIEELTPNAKAKDLYINFEKPKNFPSMKLDKRKIRQVIVNIIDNSIKYTKRGGATVKLEVIKDIVKFSVIDTGMGISPSDLPNLFKKFSRGEDTSLVHTEGTGLGLYVGKQMAEAHGGKVWIESEGVGKGSQFYFEIPVDNKPKQPEPKDEQEKIIKKEVKKEIKKEIKKNN